MKKVQLRKILTFFTLLISLNSFSQGGPGPNDGYVIVFVFCDANNNGVPDNNEVRIPGVPVTITSDSTNISVNTFTSQNGYCVGTFVNELNNYATIEIDSAYLMQNGYSFSTYSGNSILNNLNALYEPLIFFGANCNSANYGNGIGVNFIQLFCDVNNNGIFDSLDTYGPTANVYATNGNNIDTLDGGNGSIIYVTNSGISDTVTFQLDTNDLISNGYGFSVSSITTTIGSWTNSTNPTIYFPLGCSQGLAEECHTGTIFIDLDSNGVLDPTDFGLNNVPIVLSLPGQTTNTQIFTTNMGEYDYFSYNNFGDSVLIQIEPSWMLAHGYQVMSPIWVSLACAGNTITNFPLLDNGTITNCADLYAFLTPVYGYFQDTTSKLAVNWGSNGYQNVSTYDLTVTFPIGVTPLTQLFQNQNYTITGNTITWNYLGGSSNTFQDFDYLYFSVPSGIVNGAQHVYTATISSTSAATDCNLINNSQQLYMIVGNSYDPNDKNVNKPTVLDPGSIETLVYTIRFQNTGTAPAQNVVVGDQLSNNLDWSTLKVLYSSHPMQLNNYGNGSMEFSFPYIWLPDSTTNEPLSHGMFIYSVEEKSTINLGDQIENTAYIYFDWNPAIVTNTTMNVNAYLSVETKEIEDLKVAPNPFENSVTISASSIIAQLIVRDITGKIVYQDVIDSESVTLNLSDFQSGVYLVTIYSNDRTSTTRIVKQ